MDIVCAKKGGCTTIFKCDLSKTGFRGATGLFHSQDRKWNMYVCAIPLKTKVVLHSLQPKTLQALFRIQVLDIIDIALAECGNKLSPFQFSKLHIYIVCLYVIDLVYIFLDVEHIFTSSFTWMPDIELPSKFYVKLHFKSVDPVKVIPSNDDEYLSAEFKKEVALGVRELLYDEPDMELTLSDHKIELHMLKCVRFSIEENFTLEALLKLQWDHNKRRSLSMDANLITVDVLNAFINFLFEDGVDEEDYEGEAIGLLELGRCYMMPSLTSCIELTLARGINFSNVAYNILLANDYKLESLKDQCMEFIITFGDIKEVEDELLDMGLGVSFETMCNKTRKFPYIFVQIFGIGLKKLIRKGIPPVLRPKVWFSLSGAAKKKSTVPHSYYDDLTKAVEGKVTPATGQIDLDLPRTFPGHPWLDTPEGHAALRRVLVAYSFRDSDVGYCQGLNYVAALLVLVMKTEEGAFCMLVGKCHG
ncbi:unnamed protein product [Trifolium pratense]|uniref:Uncharacterized protein n=1 Tax=Trifolium pratense TaxID=57577 RepID=A0ACB0IEI8_TRIPR|nr:unnamed protein product [Trifolium pratense]